MDGWQMDGWKLPMIRLDVKFRLATPFNSVYRRHTGTMSDGQEDRKRGCKALKGAACRQLNRRR
ncbi:hypothetical protein CPB84DRAFT_1761701 [Gymnopilus junonius]|uniref:Uncharacterized protein n=1 Tax=Gymnopilus junonius TaxID=109634 RepID=A0A9P5P1G3_GYMJU|nr:hypothetical protein CPB84DRAFT_1761701 [Gymnopilus junonius]